MTLHCPNCKSTLTSHQVLENAVDTWTPNWNTFTCPSCTTRQQFQIDADLLEVGRLDGLPGPVFFPTSCERIPGLSNHPQKAGTLVIKLGDSEWQLPRDRFRDSRRATWTRALKPIAIIPCLALLAFTYVVGGMAMMQADDFNREMTAVEILVAMLWVVPVVWLILIIHNWVRAKSNTRTK